MLCQKIIKPVLQFSARCIFATAPQKSSFLKQDRYSSSSVESTKGIYELRTYSLYPDKTSEYLAFLKENFHLRTKHSKLSAFWVTEIGGCMQVVHMWYYESLNSRADVRVTMAGNEDWKNSFLTKAMPMTQFMENHLYTLTQDSPQPKFAKNLHYDLQLYNMKGSPQQWSNDLKNVVTNRESLNSSQSSLVGVWKSQIGAGNTVAMIWGHQSPDNLLELRNKLENNNDYNAFMDKSQSSYSKLLNPFLCELWS